jgi:hypothetical protein
VHRYKEASVQVCPQKKITSNEIAGFGGLKIFSFLIYLEQINSQICKNV